jgi:hypothetical protein
MADEVAALSPALCLDAHPPASHTERKSKTDELRRKYGALLALADRQTIVDLPWFPLASFSSWLERVVSLPLSVCLRSQLTSFAGLLESGDSGAVDVPAVVGGFCMRFMLLSTCLL